MHKNNFKSLLAIDLEKRNLNYVCEFSDVEIDS